DLMDVEIKGIGRQVNGLYYFDNMKGLLVRKVAQFCAKGKKYFLSRLDMVLWKKLVRAGLDHVNFFDEILHEGPDTSNDDNDLNANDQNDGSNSPEPSIKYGLERYVGYSKLTSENYCFTTELNKAFEPKTYWEACKDQHWIEAMNKEMDALYRNDTWEITDLPKDRKSIGGKWVFKIKYKSNGEIERYKARCLINLVVQNNWVLYQLDIINAFLYGDLVKTVYMDLPEGYYSPDDKRVCKLKKSIYGLKQAHRQWNAKLTQILIECGFKQSKSDYSLFTKKYCLDLLSVFGLLTCKPSATPLEQNVTISNEPTEIDKVLDNIYLTHTRPDISYSVHCLSQFMHKPLRSHIKIALKVLRYLKSSPGKGDHIVKQPKASLEAFVDADWAKCLATRKSVTGFYIELNANPVFHEKTKHLKIDLHFVREIFLSGVIKTQKISSAVQPADIFTKALDRSQHENLVLKLGMVDVFQLYLSFGALWMKLDC
ncbi:ribonuclease H-like domain-containing protein, partial [Tanacetum coccineum]